MKQNTKNKTKNKVTKTTTTYFASSTINKTKINEIIPAKQANTEVIEVIPARKTDQAIAEVDTDIQTPDLLESVASLDALPIQSLKNELNLGLMNATVASITPKDKSLIDQIMEKNAWLEMVTPASFEDIDLKASLAIESNATVNTSRKILNAFIPESLVK